MTDAVDSMCATRDTADVAALNLALDADPMDHDLRGKLADALNDAGEYELAEGMQVLGTLNRVPADKDPRPNPRNVRQGWSWWGGGARLKPLKSNFHLPQSWRKKLVSNNGLEGGSWSDTRREAEYAAARAWYRLTDEQKAVILADAK